MEKAKKNWDTRMAKNEKMQEVISEIIQKDKPKEKEKNKINFPIKNHITEYMIEDEPETEEILKVLEE